MGAYGNSTYEADVSISRGDIKIVLTDNSKLDENGITFFKSSRDQERLEEDVEETVKDNVIDVARDFLKIITTTTLKSPSVLLKIIQNQSCKKLQVVLTEKRRINSPFPFQNIKK